MAMSKLLDAVRKLRGDRSLDREFGDRAEAIVEALEAGLCDCRCPECNHRPHKDGYCNQQFRGEQRGDRLGTVSYCKCQGSESLRRHLDPNGVRCALLRDLAEALGVATGGEA